ncbi:MAG: 3-deoxy-manno-octulosonate cytidylyltransferase [Prolixibacteraceae bacterium]|nr:3-deoxy-manno-octulosonate cytidylyltransferase [Prolixibacteraceae bacterium]
MIFIGIIPARFASTRFPGKPLADINGKPMIQRVYENAKKTLNTVWVATDDQRIYDAVNNFGGDVVFTSKDHKSGTDRVAEAAKIIEKSTDFDIVINIQGDEPFIEPGQIGALKDCFSENTEIATLIKPVQTEEELSDPNKVKVVIDKNGKALYFSRSTIPYLRNPDKNRIGKCEYWAHIGMYAYRKEILQRLAELNPGKLEVAESLEQLRWLENGFSILTAKTNSIVFGIDTPEDLKKALQLFK